MAADGEGVGLVESELRALRDAGCEIRYDCSAVELVVESGRVVGLITRSAVGAEATLHAKSVVLASGGFEANAALREHYMGPNWSKAKLRGTPFNDGAEREMAIRLGAAKHGLYDGCHATPMDLHMPEYGNLKLPHEKRKNYRKICYFLGVMVNANGDRFVDEGKDFRNYTYAQFGRAVLEQPRQFAWQILYAKVDRPLYEEYHFAEAHFVEADTLDDLVMKLDGVDKERVRQTLDAYNAAVDPSRPFDPTIKHGKGTVGLDLPKSNWAQKLDTGPFKAYPVTGGITFTYGGLKVDDNGPSWTSPNGPSRASSPVRSL